MSEADRLHERGEPFFRSGALFSLLDIMGLIATCDSCGRWQRVAALTEQSARDELPRLGWRVVDGKEICPVCVKATAAEGVTR